MPQSRNPKVGPKVSKRVKKQSAPGIEREMEPKADHGEETYEGSGKLLGLSAVITGGDSGIGRAVAIAFAREGADVAIGYLSGKEEEDADETVRWIRKAGRRALKYRFNVQRPQECKKFVDKAVRLFGRLDIVVNNAAYQQEQESILDITPEQLDGTFRTNIYGYIYMVQAALPYMKEGGVILNTGSVTALKGNEKLIDYSATKGAIHAFTKALASSLAKDGIRVNCVAPGPVWTPLIPATFKSKKRIEEHGKKTYWDRPAQPSEIAPSFVFLASADAKYYTGETLAPTGSETTR